MKRLKFMFLLSFLCLQAGFSAAQVTDFNISTTLIDDQKAVLATVEPVHQFVARARIGEQ